MNDEEKKAVNKIIDVLQKVIAWDDTLGHHSKIQLLDMLIDADATLNPKESK